MSEQKQKSLRQLARENGIGEKALDMFKLRHKDLIPENATNEEILKAYKLYMSKQKKPLTQLAKENEIKYTSILSFCNIHKDLIPDNATNEEIVQAYKLYMSEKEQKTLKHLAKRSEIDYNSLIEFKRLHKDLIPDNATNEEIVQIYKDLKPTDRKGETQIMSCGLKATIVEYKGCTDVTIKFEDGEIREHINYDCFLRGNVKHPKLRNPNFKNRMGETRTMNCGLKATIIEYNNADDITIKFEDDTVKEHTSYRYFKRGALSNRESHKNIIGETRTMNCGLKATVIERISYEDITLVFENGDRVEHVGYDKFKKGKVSNIKRKDKIKQQVKDRVGETQLMNCGLNATILEYIGPKDITVKFEDSRIVRHVSYSRFKQGKVTPEINIISEYRKIRKLNKPIKLKLAFYNESTDTKYLECNCVKCGYSGIYTLQEILKHPCTNN